MEKSNLEQSINEIKDLEKKVDEMIDEEDENSPSYKLYKEISESTIQLLSTEGVKTAFNEISKSIGDETSKHLVELMAICMTHSAFNAMVIYDNLMRKGMTSQLDDFADRINQVIAVVNAHEGVLKVFRQRLDEITASIRLK